MKYVVVARYKCYKSPYNLQPCEHFCNTCDIADGGGVLMVMVVLINNNNNNTSIMYMVLST